MFTVNWKTVAKVLGGIAGVSYNLHGRNGRVTTRPLSLQDLHCIYKSARRIYRAYIRERKFYKAYTGVSRK